MSNDEKTAKDAWEAWRLHYGAGRGAVGTSWEQLPEEQRQYLIGWARFMRERGWLPT